MQFVVAGSVFGRRSARRRKLENNPPSPANPLPGVLAIPGNSAGKIAANVAKFGKYRMISPVPIAILCLICLSWIVPAADAILIRPDRDDAKYVELARKFPSSISLNLPDGEGALIAPRWILTAAHLANDIKTADASPKLAIGGGEYRVQRVIVHPEFRRAAMGRDIALILLDRDVKDVTPTPIYRGKSEAEKIVTIVGHGFSGTLDRGPVSKDKWDKIQRAATQKIERIGDKKHWLMFPIDPPETATDLEGSGGPGDSGGPAFLEENGKLYVAGISSFTDDSNADQIDGNYGDWEAYTRVAAYAEWIDSVLAANP